MVVNVDRCHLSVSEKPAVLLTWRRGRRVVQSYRGTRKSPRPSRCCSGPPLSGGCSSGWRAWGQGANPNSLRWQRVRAALPVPAAEGLCSKQSASILGAGAQNTLSAARCSGYVQGAQRDRAGVTALPEDRVPAGPQVSRDASHGEQVRGPARTQAAAAGSQLQLRWLERRALRPRAAEMILSSCCWTGSCGSRARYFQRPNHSGSAWRQKRGPAPGMRWLLCLSGQAGAADASQCQAARAPAALCLSGTDGHTRLQGPSQARSARSAWSAPTAGAEALAERRVAAVVISERPSRISPEATCVRGEPRAQTDRCVSGLPVGYKASIERWQIRDQYKMIDTGWCLLGHVNTNFS